MTLTTLPGLPKTVSNSRAVLLRIGLNMFLYKVVRTCKIWWHATLSSLKCSGLKLHAECHNDTLLLFR